jgi:DNA-binding response OmpR family regulator
MLSGLMDRGMEVMTKPFTVDALASRVQSIISD